MVGSPDFTKKSAIFFDLDGTLCHYEGTTTPALQKAFKTLHQRGHQLFISTGRTLCEIPDEILSLNFHGIISGIGAHIMLGSNVLLNESIPYPMLMEAVDALLHHKVDTFLLGPQNMFSLVGKPSHRSPVTYIETSADLHALAPAPQISSLDLMFENIQQVEACLPAIQQHSQFIQYTPHSGQTRLNQHTKATGIQKIMDTLEQKNLPTIAIGDTLNDLEMLQHVNYGIAMGNAAEELKKHADYVTKTIEEDGVVHALSALNLI